MTHMQIRGPFWIYCCSCDRRHIRNTQPALMPMECTMFCVLLVCLFLFLLHLFSAVDLIRPQSRQDKWHRWHLLHSQWASLQYIWCYYDLFSLPPRARAAVRRTMNCAWQFICSLVVLLTFRWRSFEDNKFLLTYHKTNHFRSMTRELLLGTF